MLKHSYAKSPLALPQLPARASARASEPESGLVWALVWELRVRPVAGAGLGAEVAGADLAALGAASFDRSHQRRWLRAEFPFPA